MIKRKVDFTMYENLIREKAIDDIFTTLTYKKPDTKETLFDKTVSFYNAIFTHQEKNSSINYQAQLREKISKEVKIPIKDLLWTELRKEFSIKNELLLRGKIEKKNPKGKCSWVVMFARDYGDLIFSIESSLKADNLLLCYDNLPTSRVVSLIYFLSGMYEKLYICYAMTDTQIIIVGQKRKKNVLFEKIFKKYLSAYDDQPIISSELIPEKCKKQIHSLLVGNLMTRAKNISSYISIRSDKELVEMFDHNAILVWKELYG